MYQGIYAYEYDQAQRAYHAWRNLCNNNPGIEINMPDNPHLGHNPMQEQAWFDGWNDAANAT